ncbi:MFS domain-containing protein [Aphelenchoides bicaudatus]|nr:MFS domain-containing protein [Aphelenchoides bicaudatus]
MLSEQIESLTTTTDNNKDDLYQNLDAEKVLERLGKYGRFQMLIYAMTSVGALLCGFEIMSMPLVVKEDIQFECVSNDPSIQVIDKCTVYNLINNMSFACGQVANTYLKFDEVAKNTLNGEFELVCDKAFWSHHATSLFMLGGQFATPIIATLSDRYGRRRAFLLPLWITVIANIGCSIAPNYYLFLLFRVISGAASAGIGPVGFIIQIENTTTSFRSLSPLFMTVVWFVGYMGIGVLHMFVPNWRWHFFSFSAPCLLTFTFYWMMPETIHWMISNNQSNNQTSGVKNYIKKSCRINKQKIQLSECQNSFNRSESLTNKKKAKTHFHDCFF